MKFLRFLSLAVSVVLAFYSAFPNDLSPFMRTAIFAGALVFLLLFALLTTLSRAWERMVGMACAILFVCLAFIPAAIFQSLSMAEIFGVEELAAVESVQLTSLDARSTLIIWTPDGNAKVTVQADGENERVFNLSGASADLPTEYAKNAVIRNYWMGEAQEYPYNSVAIRFTDGHQINLLNSRKDSWGISWSSNDAEPEQLDGQWTTPIPVTELFAPQVLEEINAILGAS